MTVLYNDTDPFCAAWLRNLIAAGHLPPGHVDERSIADLTPSDLAGVRQFHAFAGIGGWPYALRLAGWPEDEEVWTGSCPCQPFSQAGKGDGAADPRHLWPAWFRLIRECRPHTIVGEQVSGRDGLAWLDRVHHDLEGCGYAVGAVTLPAASVGASHLRHRIFFVADADQGRWRTGESASPSRGRDSEPEGRRHDGDVRHELGHAPRERQQGVRWAGQEASSETAWSDAVWLACRDGKWRPTQPGVFPLVDGPAFRLADGRTRDDTSRAKLLRGIGNAIVPQVAAAFVRARLAVGWGP